MKLNINYTSTYPDVIAGGLIESFALSAEKYNQPTSSEYDHFCALTVARNIRDNTPMYTGNLNPKWKFWDSVCKEIVENIPQEWNLKTD